MGKDSLRLAYAKASHTQGLPDLGLLHSLFCYICTFHDEHGEENLPYAILWLSALLETMFYSNCSLQGACSPSLRLESVRKC